MTVRSAFLPLNVMPRGCAFLGVLALVCTMTVPIVAKATEQGPAVWIGTAVRVPFAERYAFRLLTQPRFINNVTNFRILLVRPWFEVAIPQGFSVALGYDALIFFQPTQRTEHRIWEQISHRHAWERFRVDSRFRLEQRFFSDVSEVSVRGRFLLGMAVPLVVDIELILNNEFFVNFNEVPILGERGYHENRLFGGFSRRFGRWTQISVGYQMQWLDPVGTNLVNHTVMLGAAFDTPPIKRRSQR
jgi:hypothetical protein